MAELSEGEAPRMPYEQGEGMTEAEAADALGDAADAIIEEPTDLEGYPEDEDSEADEDAPDDALDDEEDADDPEEEDEESEEDPDEPTYKVKVDGEEVEVPLSELLAGYSRTSDYTKKTMDLAVKRRQVDAEWGEAAQDRQGLAAMMEAYKRFGAQHLPPEVQQAIAADYDSLVQNEMYRMQQSHEETVRAEQEVLHEVMEWKDPAVAKEGKQRLANYLTNDLGFTPEQLNGVTDHRLLVMAEESRRYREMTGEGAKATLQAKTKNVPVLKPGGRAQSAPGKGKRKAKAAAMDRLRRTGSAKDAAKLIEFGILDID